MRRSLGARKVLLATNNTHKISEIKGILGPHWQITSSMDLATPPRWEEDGGSFTANALIKAKAFQKLASGFDILAEDSGLCIAALQGAPGVDSAHYAGPNASSQANMAKVLKGLKGVPADQRQAYFTCCLVFLQEGGAYFTFEGHLGGHITTQARGKGGFGYDPIFIPAGYSQTLAEMSAAEKNSLSHRLKALLAWQSWLESPS